MEWRKDPRSGKVVLLDGGRVQLRDQAGAVFQADPETWQQDAERLGLVLAKPSEVAAHDQRKRSAEATVGQVVGTAAESAGAALFDVATAPARLPTAVVSGLAGVEDPLSMVSGRQFIEDVAAVAAEATGGSAEQAARLYAEKARERASASPGVAFGSRMVAEVGGGLATGGLSGLGAGVGRTALGRVGAAAAASAAEGAALGAAQASEDAYLADIPLSAEARLGAIGWGTLLGGAAGGVGAGLGAAGKKLFGRAPTAEPAAAVPARAGASAEQVAKDVLGVEAAPGLGAKLMDALNEPYSRAAAALTGVEQETIRDFGAFARGPKAARGHYLHANREAIIDAATTDMTAKVERVLRALPDINEEVINSNLKRGLVAKNLEGIDVPTARKAGTDAMARFRAEIDDMAAHPDHYGNAKVLAKESRWVAGVEKKVWDKLDSPADIYMELDQARRAIQKRQKAAQLSAQRVTGVEEIGTARAYADRLQHAYHRLADDLMDENAWGAQGAAQKSVNRDGWVRLIQDEEAAGKHLATIRHRDMSGRPVMDADPDKIGRYLRGLGARGELKDRYIRSYLTSAKRMAGLVQEHYDLPAAKLAKVREVSDAVDSIHGTLAHVDETVKVANQIDTMFSVGATGGLDAVLGGAGGAMFAGPLGALAGMALGAARRPGQTMLQAIAVRKMVAKLDSEIGRKVGAALAPTTKRAPVHGPMHAVERGRPTGRARSAVTAALSAFTGDESPQIAYEKHAKHITELATNDTLRQERVGAAMGATATGLPRMHAVESAKATRAVQYLASQLPAGREHGGLTPHLARAQVSLADVAAFAAKWRTVREPLTVLDDLASGTLTREQIEALRAVHPAIYERIVMQVRTRLADAKHPVPYDQRRGLDLLLGLDGAGEPSVSPEFLRRIAAVGKLLPVQPPAGRPPAPVAKSVMSKLQTQTSSAAEAMS